MQKTRLETFSDGVIAILITIMVLELPIPHGTDLHALEPVLPVLLAYVLSFIYLGIYWNNHHHMLHAADHVDGRILWANMHLLFWLSLVPFTTAWLTENGIAPLSTAAYGVVLALTAVAYSFLQISIIAHGGPNAHLREAVGRDYKGKLSIVLYLFAIFLAWANPWISIAFYVLVAGMWFIPDRRIERKSEHRH